MPPKATPRKHGPKKRGPPMSGHRTAASEFVGTGTTGDDATINGEEEEEEEEDDVEDAGGGRKKASDRKRQVANRVRAEYKTKLDADGEKFSEGDLAALCEAELKPGVVS